MRWWIAIIPWLTCLLFCSSIHAQSDLIIEPKPPQANSREELDAYLDLIQKQEPAQLVGRAADFARRFPASEFLGQVYRLEMRNYQTLNDHQNTVAAGEKVLRVSPRDPEGLLTLAKVLASFKSEKAANLSRAEMHANSALEAIRSLKAPRSLGVMEFEQIKSRMQAGAHEALGIIAFQRKQYAESVSEFEHSIRLHPSADGGLYYRLGVAYLFTNSRDKARATLQRAAELGPGVVRARAEGQLAELQ